MSLAQTVEIIRRIILVWVGAVNVSESCAKKYQIAEKLDDDDVVLESLDAAPDLLPKVIPKPVTKAPMHVSKSGAGSGPVVLKVAVKTDEGLVKRAKVTPSVTGYGVFLLRSDEGTSLPMGTDSAPCPLDYFAAGATFCFTSHLTVTARMRKMDVRNIEVESEMRFEYSSDGRGSCLGVRTLVKMDSDETEDRIRQLLFDVKRMCLAEAALTNQVPIQTLVSLNGRLMGANIANSASVSSGPASIQGK